MTFIHGGYWRSLSSKEFGFIAKGFLKLGFTVVLPNYSLCPKVSIEQITKQNRCFIKWLYHNIEKFSGDKEQLHLCGHSAGAQQVAMLTLTNWQDEFDLPSNIIKTVTAISGIFDLTPLRYSWLQADLQLTVQTVLSQSPQLLLEDNKFNTVMPPLLLSVGASESTEFIRQSQDYLSQWKNMGYHGELIIQQDKNHFTVLHQLYNECSDLCNEIRSFIQKTKY